MTDRDVARWQRRCQTAAKTAGVAGVICAGFACGVLYAAKRARPAAPGS